MSRIYVSNLPKCPVTAFGFNFDIDDTQFEIVSPQGQRFYVPDWYKGKIAREGIGAQGMGSTYADGATYKATQSTQYDRLTPEDKTRVQLHLFKMLVERAYERIRSQYGLWIDFIYANFKTEIHDKTSYNENIKKAIACLVQHFMRAISENQFQSYTLQLGSTNLSTPIDYESTRYCNP